MVNKFEPSESVTLQPPKFDLISVEELAKHDGSDDNLPIYVAIKGIVFDVTSKRSTYKKGANYNVFAGRDASYALGKMSLKPEDLKADYSALDATEMKILDDWLEYYTKRYNIIGRTNLLKQMEEVSECEEIDSGYGIAVWVVPYMGISKSLYIP